MRKFKILSGSLILIAFFSACSTAPKKETDVYSDRGAAERILSMANHTANRGRFDEALLILQEARRLALSTDDPSLRIRTTISRGNFLFSLGRVSQAFTEWEIASEEGDASGEPVLAALARIYSIRSKFVLLSAETGIPEETGQAKIESSETLMTLLAEEMVKVRSDSFATASGYVTLALAEKHMGRYIEAEAAARRALDLHDRNRSLEDASYDWFLIASIRSVDGNYDTALLALRMAINLDRRSENGFGLASSWQAMGDIYQKMGQPEESKAAWKRAADIYRAIGLENIALKLEKEL